MGESACWAHRVCDVCGRVAEHVDEERRCPDCRDGETRRTGEDLERDSSADHCS